MNYFIIKAQKHFYLLAVVVLAATLCLYQAGGTYAAFSYLPVMPLVMLAGTYMSARTTATLMIDQSAMIAAYIMTARVWQER